MQHCNSKAYCTGVVTKRLSTYRWLQVPEVIATSFPPLLSNKLEQPCTRCPWAAPFGPTECAMQGGRLAFAGAAGPIGAEARASGRPRTMSHTFWGPAPAVAQLQPCAHQIVKCKGFERTNMRPAAGPFCEPRPHTDSWAIAPAVSSLH